MRIPVTPAEIDAQASSGAALNGSGVTVDAVGNLLPSPAFGDSGAGATCEAHCAASAVVFTYFIHCADTERVKIGRSRDPWKRLRECQVGSPTDLTLLGYLPFDIEGQLHAEYRRDCVGGEWFDLSLRLKALIDGLIATAGVDATVPRHTLGNVGASDAFVLPPLHVGRNAEEEAWIYEVGMLMAAAGRPYADIYGGTIAIPRSFYPLVPCVTTRNAYREYCVSYVPPVVDYDQFWATYPATYASIVAGTPLAAGRMVGGDL